MSFFGPDSWLQSPPDRDIIAKWTVGRERKMSYELVLPPESESQSFEFLAFGDTGDTDFTGRSLSPQEAVARELAAEAALPGSPGSARLVLHMGDVVYMTGERRLYDRNFRRPYAPFLCPESTVDNLVFRLPFLPVPGNHDYYDLGGWVSWLTRVPLLGAGIRRITNEIFAFNFPEGGSQRGKAYMDSFVDPEADTSKGPLEYRPGQITRIPNRYYKFSAGSVDFFALDSNTLDAAPPARVNTDTLKVETDARIEALSEQSAAIDEEFKLKQQTCSEWRDNHLKELAADPHSSGALAGAARGLVDAFASLSGALSQSSTTCSDQAADSEAQEHRWSTVVDELTDAGQLSTAQMVLQALNSVTDAGQDACDLLGRVDGCLAELPECPDRSAILKSRDSLDCALQRWTELVEPVPPEFCSTLRDLSEKALDVQRELAMEKRRMQYSPEDYDLDQIDWLNNGLDESVRRRPGAWRIVYLHHPIYSTIGNHCEGKDVRAVRNNLLPVLRDRVHLVLSGHSHAFEWIRSSAMPNAGLFVTGGGGQVSLRRSILDPRRLSSNLDRYRALQQSGVTECAIAGRGPAAQDGENGPLYHFLRIEVRPDVLTVRPIGVRRLAADFRREAPLPAFHVSSLQDTLAPWISKSLDRVEIRRGSPPIPIWT